MKFVLAIVCSFVLAGTPLLLAQASSPVCAKQPTHACCQNGETMPCCESKPAPDSQPVPAVPTQSGNQAQISLLFASAIVVWVLPEAATTQFYSGATIPFTATGSPLYTRDCALLI